MNRMLGQKLAVIGLLILVIWIALLLVSGVIGDRQKYRDDAVRSIESSYAGPQIIIGPLLVRPYTQTTQTTVVAGDTGVRRNVSHTETLTATTFPRELSVVGKLFPSERRHGLYKVPVYEFRGIFSGEMIVVDPKTEGSVEWGEPYLAFSVADVRGIVGTPQVKVGAVQETMFQSSLRFSDWQPNLRVPLHGLSAMHGELPFAISIDLAGTQALSVAPVGDSNHVELTSSWTSPLFGGQFLPRFRELGKNGFAADWDVSSLASGTQVQMMASPIKPIDLMEVSLLAPLDPYKLSDRATKYGILFVVLTFGGFFLFEMIKQLPIHPVQYLLVGFGLAIFFLLLTSFSERIAFGAAYLIASAACIGLLTFYLSAVLHRVSRGLGFGALLTTVYAAVYGLLISEDNALILGSLLLFAVLAVVMVITRRVDWYKGSAELVRVKAEASTTAVAGPPRV